MPLIRINRNPSGGQLRVFALAWLGILGVAGWISWFHGRNTVAAIAWILAAAVPLAGLADRRALRLVYVGLSLATYPVGFVVSHAVLALVYFLILTPIGLAMRLFGRDPLARRFDPRASSYWIPRGPERPAENYFRQS
jgi:Saxitoxin biosynthesis operon protein SxtJ